MDNEQNVNNCVKSSRYIFMVVKSDVFSSLRLQTRFQKPNSVLRGSVL
jgi:hypothetical protein